MPGRLRPGPLRPGQPPLRRGPDPRVLRRAGGRPPVRGPAADIPRHGTLIRVAADQRPGGRSRAGWPPSGRPWPRPRPAGPPRPRRPRPRRRQRGRGRLVAITDPPKIVTGRLGYADSHTLERYLATGGYDGLRKALAMTPEAVAAEVDTASLLGPGRGRLPGRPQVGHAAQGPGDLPGGQRRRERAGHLQGPPAGRAGPPPAHRGRAHRRLRPAGDAGCSSSSGASSPSASSGCQAALNDAYAHGAVGRRHLRLRVLGRRGGAPRGRRLHLRRGDRPARVARGQAGLPPHQAAVLPGRHRPLRRAHRGQQRGDHVQPALDRASTAGPPSPPWARAGPPGPGCSPWPATSTTPASSSWRWSRPPSAT